MVFKLFGSGFTFRGHGSSFPDDDDQTRLMFYLFGVAAVWADHGGSEGVSSC